MIINPVHKRHQDLFISGFPIIMKIHHSQPIEY